MLRFFVTFLVLLAVIAGGIGYAYYQNTNEPPKPLYKIEPKQFEQVPSFNMLLIQIDTAQNRNRLLTCQENGCSPTRQPASAQANPLYDGESWYVYTKRQNEAGEDRLILERQWENSNKRETIVAQSPLVKPRGLYISPDGKRIAYWLDSTENDELTELWLYDSLTEKTSLIAENITVDNILTEPRFNKFGSQIFLIADNAENEREDKIELIVINTDSVGKNARFLTANWQELMPIIEKGVVDINREGTRLALTAPTAPGSAELLLVDDGAKPEQQDLRGHIPFLQWLEDESLLYVVQDGPEFIFWKRYPDGEDLPVARLDGVIRSAHGDSAGEYIAFVADTHRQETRAYTLQLSTGLVRDQGAVPAFGQHVHVVYATPNTQASVAGITSELTPGELIAFIEQNKSAITGDQSQLSRIVTTDQPNTAFVDYRDEAGQLRRLLLIVRDATHHEWTIRARYEQQYGSWQQIQGGSLAQPQPLKLYEWEGSVNQWIEKETFGSSP